jgi:DNA-binding NarL/FixJ family response regulator
MTEAQELKPRIKYTRRERSVIALILEGKTNVEISQDLGVSDKSIKNYVYNIYKKAGVKNRASFIIRELRLRHEINANGIEHTQLTGV